MFLEIGFCWLWLAVFFFFGATAANGSLKGFELEPRDRGGVGIDGDEGVRVC